MAAVNSSFRDATNPLWDSGNPLWDPNLQFSEAIKGAKLYTRNTFTTLDSSFKGQIKMQGGFRAPLKMEPSPAATG